MDQDRRESRRQEVRFPLECAPAGDVLDHVLRGVTRNISSSGLAFEMDLLEGMASPKPQSLMNIQLTVPPGDGHFPYQGSISSVAEVLRCEAIPAATLTPGNGRGRVRIAARFREPLKLVF
jgi:hypothetical protein